MIKFYENVFIKYWAMQLQTLLECLVRHCGHCPWPTHHLSSFSSPLVWDVWLYWPSLPECPLSLCMRMAKFWEISSQHLTNLCLHCASTWDKKGPDWREWTSQTPTQNKIPSVRRICVSWNWFAGLLQMNWGSANEADKGACPAKLGRQSRASVWRYKTEGLRNQQVKSFLHNYWG